MTERQGQGRPALDRLRDATRDQHAALDGALDVLAALGCPARRPGMVARYRDFHRGAAALLRDWPVAGRRSWLDADGASGMRSPWWDGFAPANAAEALGFRYVIEGSALGGRAILLELARRGVDTAELGFLDRRVDGAPWRELLELLERDLASDAARHAAARGAEKGFRFAWRALVETDAGRLERVA